MTQFQSWLERFVQCLSLSLVLIGGLNWLVVSGVAAAADVCPVDPSEPCPCPAMAPAQSCSVLEKAIRRSGATPLRDYECALQAFVTQSCYRSDEGWKVDKGFRDTGPFIATLQNNGVWKGHLSGLHNTVVVYYSHEMYDWLKKNRPNDGSALPAEPAPVPDGAVIIKEMYDGPAAALKGVDPSGVLPKEQGVAVMVRDSTASRDGWFWGWVGWPGSGGWAPDWPAGNANSVQGMGLGLYCLNCHASAKDNQTYSSLDNIKGEKGNPLPFLSQYFFLDSAPAESAPAESAPTERMMMRRTERQIPHHKEIAAHSSMTQLLLGRLYNPAFAKAFNSPFAEAFPSIAGGAPPPDQSPAPMPSQTYDHVWVKAQGPKPASEFLTSDQCVGCHDAGGTGLQYDMTKPQAHGALLQNLSPYGGWSMSPMGLSGRDPVFFAQLASEDNFHPRLASEDKLSSKKFSGVLQDVCLGCHGVLGQRQFKVDKAEPAQCDPLAPDPLLFPRQDVNAVPFPPQEASDLWNYGSLARDGVSCTACHRMVMGKEATDKYGGETQNRCLAERQKLLNPNLRGFASTFTGSFLVGPPDILYGPFEKPKTRPMLNALGVHPEQSGHVLDSELCGTCHTVHLPVLAPASPDIEKVEKVEKILPQRIYEQTTYPEWAFSAYRTGKTADGPLPLGAGEKPRSCQDCHMPSREDDGSPVRSKIAGIEEYSNYPRVANTLPAEEIDLPVRSGFARHTLVGLNLFFLKMAEILPRSSGHSPG